MFEGRASYYVGQLTVTPKMVANKIRDMNDNKSLRVDGIPRKLLLKIAEQISIPLATVFNLSLDEGISWKKAHIISYHYLNKASMNKLENYRLVNLLSAICKLLERLNKDHLVDFQPTDVVCALGIFQYTFSC